MGCTASSSAPPAAAAASDSAPKPHLKEPTTTHSVNMSVSVASPGSPPPSKTNSSSHVAEITSSELKLIEDKPETKLIENKPANSTPATPAPAASSASAVVQPVTNVVPSEKNTDAVISSPVKAFKPESTAATPMEPMKTTTTAEDHDETKSIEEAPAAHLKGTAEPDTGFAPPVPAVVGPPSSTVPAESTSSVASPQTNENNSRSNSVPTKSSMPAPQIKKGMVLKEGHIVRNWKNRYFVLEKGKLTYYESQSSEYPFGVGKKGDLSLKGVTLVCSKSMISLNTKNEAGKEVLALNLDIKYPNERDEWMEALKQHIEYINSA
jgi:hypothetical protein